MFNHTFSSPKTPENSVQFHPELYYSPYSLKFCFFCRMKNGSATIKKFLKSEINGRRIFYT